MSACKPPLLVSSLALLAALSLHPGEGLARDGMRVDEDVVKEIAPLSADRSREVIFVMPPMKPVKGAVARAKKPAPPIADRSAPAVVAATPPAQVAATTEPPTVDAAAKPEAPGIEAPKPAETAQPTAEAAEHVEPAQPPAGEASPAAPAPETAPKAPEAETPPATAQAAPPVEASQPQAAPVTEATADAASNPPPPAASAPEAPPVPAPEQAAPEAQAAETADARIEALLAQGLPGPTEVRLADRATMWLPAGRVFLPLETARKLASEVALDWRPGVQGIVAPAGGKLDWLAPVELLDDGHIDAGDPAALDPAKLLAEFEASLPEVNARRAGAGQPAVSLQGWLAPPALDAKYRLSACVNVATAGDPERPDRFFNCEAWALGRDGALKVAIADGEAQAPRLMSEARAIVGTIVFDHAKAYADFDPATDRAAPYSAAHLPIRDVGAKAAAPAPAHEAKAQEIAAPESDAPGSLLDTLLYPGLFGGAALLLYLRMKRKREEEAAAGDTPAAAEPPSLFARLLPTLHARFARQAAPAAPESKPAPERAQSKTGDSGASGGPRATLSGAPSAMPANDAEEPVSILKRVAGLMRRSSEPPPQPVSTARVMRPARGRTSAALALAPEVEQRSAAAAGDAAEMRSLATEGDTAETAANPVGATLGADDFGLVEPGDVEAASAAIRAAQARQAAAR